MIKKVCGVVNAGEIINAKVECYNDLIVATIKRENVAAAEYVDIQADLFTAEMGDEGYFVTAGHKRFGFLTYFTEREDCVDVQEENVIPIYGVKRRDYSALAIPVGMKYEMRVVVALENGRYSLRQRILLYGKQPYEDISIRYKVFEKSADYFDMAVFYRNLLLEKGRIAPLREKIKTRPELAYAVEAPEIRIRMGWKPVPSPVDYQTPETEPPIHVACTFARVKDLIVRLKEKGVEKAQLCLVGWNKGGHDGRWPDALPVEEALGGEKGLNDLVAFAKKNGYQIVCHTNSTDAYHISPKYPECLAKDSYGEPILVGSYGGGLGYKVCPHKAREIAEQLLPEVAKLGFRGLHYVDVMGVINPVECFHEEHPCNGKEAVEEYLRIMKLCKENFGGFASEGAYDFAAEYVDYGLYVGQGKPEPDGLYDLHIPLHQLIFHGIVLTNPSTATINYPIRDRESQLYFWECGGRPSFYIYQKFIAATDSMANWLGKDDLLLDTEEQLEEVAELIAESYREYRGYWKNQLEYVEKYELLSDDVREITYTNGSKLWVDYKEEVLRWNTEIKEKTLEG